MRFEIRAGGLIFILLCLGGLSAAVFVFGLIAGHEMARQEQVAQEAAAVYPLPSLPEAMATPAPAISQASAVPAEKAAPAAGSASVSSTKSSAGPGLATKRSPTAALRPSASGASVGGSSEESAEENSADENPDIEAAPAPTPVVRHKNYSVQIEAVMDQQGANDMVAKLKRMGYSPYTVETNIGGQTWYRVRVGPYPTPEEAKAVETKLHQDYGSGSTH
jgi:cell division septation protein DedD